MRDIQKIFDDLKSKPMVEKQRIKSDFIDPMCGAISNLIDRLDAQHRSIIGLREDYVSLSEKIKRLEVGTKRKISADKAIPASEIDPNTGRRRRGRPRKIPE